MPNAVKSQEHGGREESVGASSNGRHYAMWIVVSCIAICCLPCALILSCAGIFFTPVSDYFGVPKAQFTLYFSVLNLAMMVTLPVAGRALARRDARVVPPPPWRARPSAR